MRNSIEHLFSSCVLSLTLRNLQLYKIMCSKLCLSFVSDSDVIIANTNELYTEPVTGHGRKNEDEHYKDLIKKDSDGAVLSSVYDRFNFF